MCVCVCARARTRACVRACVCVLEHMSRLTTCCPVCSATLRESSCLPHTPSSPWRALTSSENSHFLFSFLSPILFLFPFAIHHLSLLCPEYIKFFSNESPSHIPVKKTHNHHLPSLPFLSFLSSICTLWQACAWNMATLLCLDKWTWWIFFLWHLCLAFAEIAPRTWTRMSSPFLLPLITALNQRTCLWPLGIKPCRWGSCTTLPKTFRLAWLGLLETFFLLLAPDGLNNTPSNKPNLCSHQLHWQRKVWIAAHMGLFKLTVNLSAGLKHGPQWHNVMDLFSSSSAYSAVMINRLQACTVHAFVWQTVDWCYPWPLQPPCPLIFNQQRKLVQAVCSSNQQWDDQAAFTHTIKLETQAPYHISGIWQGMLFP